MELEISKTQKQGGAFNLTRMTTINQKEANEIINNGGVTVIDVRTPGEHGTSCLEGSVNIDFLDKSFPAKIESLNKNGKYLVYCGSGGRSLRAAKLMDQKGFLEVFNLEGGIMAWLEKGMPTTRN